MREIKFKIWDEENKKIIEWEELRLLPVWEVFTKNTDKDTMKILEFSGMSDRLGNQLYEGDIVEYENEKYCVNYLNSPKCWKLMGVSIRGDLGGYRIDGVARKSLLLANQYMHPELLKEYLNEYTAKLIKSSKESNENS